ncbi:MAG: patatin-like phospholipase family protein [Candidatus Promineifilaceae bacterium]|nr:patatin-like phospholipase family protein [Candidatus Promineifilaceae bacterium]
MSHYRVLALDGGGIRGLITIVMLQELEQRVPGWLHQVDLIAGTSTGGIIALGLGNGLTLAELRGLYYERGPLIFADSVWDNVRDLFGLLGAQYGLENLRRELEARFGSTTLQALSRKVLVTTFDMRDPEQGIWKPKFFHNFSGPDSDGQARASDVALYTSAAPTYFPWADRYIDGGVVATNPSMAALAQTQDERNERGNFHDGRRPNLAEIRLLSLGTGMLPQSVSGQDRDWGYLQWVKWGDQHPLIDLVLEGGAGVADYQCRQLLGRRGYRRVNPMLPRPIDLDGWQARDEFIRIGEQADLDEVAQWLANEWLS